MAPLPVANIKRQTKLDFFNGQMRLTITPTAPPKTQTQYMELKTKLTQALTSNKAEVSLLERYRNWEQLRIAEEGSTFFGEVDLDVNILSWTQTLDVVASSRRTYFLRTLGAWSTEVNRRFPSTPRLAKIKRWLVLQSASHQPVKAPFMSSAQIASLPVFLKITLLTAARIGNACGFKTILVEDRDFEHPYRESGVRNERPTLRWSYRWLDHKTKHIVGPRNVTMYIPKEPLWKEAIEMIRNSKGRASVISTKDQHMMIRWLAENQTKLHSIRRSGLKYWHQEGLPYDQLMNISLHKSVDQLISYLEGWDDDDEVEEAEGINS